MYLLVGVFIKLEHFIPPFCLQFFMSLSVLDSSSCHKQGQITF